MHEEGRPVREQVIEVDDHDRMLSIRSRSEAHVGAGILHRAFSVFLFGSSGRLLLQQRSRNKVLWPGYWSNSCCSHPRPGEDTSSAAVRRIREELRVHSPVQYVYKFRYHARYQEHGCEHELCSVFLARCSETIAINEYEVEQIDWVLPAELDERVRHSPLTFTPWLRLEWEALRGTHREALEAFLRSDDLPPE